MINETCKKFNNNFDQIIINSVGGMVVTTIWIIGSLLLFLIDE